jgi:RNA polymerase sigma-70 factor (ECF subfamily)
MGREPESERPPDMTQPLPSREEFTRCLESQLDRLYGAARRLTRNDADAEDLVAETVARAWSSLDTLEDPARLVPWMLRIMTNHFISERRKPANRAPHEEYLEEPEGEEAPFFLFERLHQPILLWWGNPERQFLDQLLKKDIAAALDALPEPYRLVVVLSDLEGLTYQEIAESLGIPVGTVRSRLARARSQLQKSLWKHACDKGLIDKPPSE